MPVASTTIRRVIIPIYGGDAMKLSELSVDCIDYYVKKGRMSANTRENYDRTHRQFIAYLMQRQKMDDVRNFTPQTAEGFMEALLTAGIKASTVRNKLSALATLARFGMRRTGARGKPYLTENPLKLFDWPAKPQTETPFVYPGDEIRKLMRLERPLGESLARDLLIDTAVRASELAGLNVADVVDEHGGVWLRVIRKGGQEEYVAVSDAAAEGVRDYLIARNMPDGDAPLLLNSLGERWTRQALGELIARMGRKAGINRFRLSPHKLRHTSSVIAQDADLDDFTQSRLLGHKSTRTLRRYQHTLPSKLRAAREAHRRAFLRYVGEEPAADCATQGDATNTGEITGAK